MNRHLVIDKEKIAKFCERHDIRRLAVFGSVLRADFAPDSDIDVLVDFLPGHLCLFKMATGDSPPLSSECQIKS